MFLLSHNQKSNNPMSQYSMPQSHNEATLIPVLGEDELLGSIRTQKWLQELSEIVVLPEKMYYNEIYSKLVSRFAEFVQLIPAVEGGALGGLLEESLQRAKYALEAYLTEKEEEPLFAYAVFSAALLLDLRKVLANKKIIFSNERGEFLSEWWPFAGSMTARDLLHYKIRVFNRPITRISPYVNVLLARQVMPEAGFLWLSQDLNLLNMWLAALSGDEEGAGSLWLALQLSKQKQQMEKVPRLVMVPVDTLLPSQTELGEAFWQWLRQNLAEGQSFLNDMAYVTDDLIFLDVPRVFQTFSEKNNISDWKLVQAQFLKLGIALAPSDLGIDNNKVTEQLLIYFTKEDIVARDDQKMAQAGSKTFFGNKALEQRISAIKEEGRLQADYRRQGWLMSERDWFTKVSRKMENKKIIKEISRKYKKDHSIDSLKKLFTDDFGKELGYRAW